MIRGQEIVDLVELLEVRSTCLYHACQFADFQAYLRLGGIPSRAYLEQNQERFTPFETDRIDQDNDVWDKVFVNLSDFGHIFGRGANGVPNPFGPIVLQIKPSALLEATDVAVCLRSAGSKGFDRHNEALGSAHEVDSLFLYTQDRLFPESIYVKSSKRLQETFPRAANPEISCSVGIGYLQISNVIVAWIDPYQINDRPLITWVKEAMDENSVTLKVWERSCREDRRALYGELLTLLYPSCMPLHDIAIGKSVTQCLRIWAEELLEKDLNYQFRRYADYLNTGTVRPIMTRCAITKMDEAAKYEPTDDSG